MPICPICKVAYLDGESHVCEEQRGSPARTRGIVIGAIFGAILGCVGLALFYCQFLSDSNCGLVGLFIGAPLGAVLGAAIGGFANPQQSSYRKG